MTEPAAPREVVVVVAGPHEEMGEVREVFDAWSRACLLKEVLWVDQRELDGLKPQTGTDIGATLLAAEPRRTMLFSELAKSSAQLVRLVCLQLVADDRSVAKELAGGARLLRGEIDLRLARAQQQVSINVIVPSSATTFLPEEILLPGWNANIVVAPEDRHTDLRADQGVRRPGNYAAHAAFGCATVAGLWRPMPGGPFDRHRQPPVDPCHLLVTRSFGRVLIGYGLVDELLAQAFELRAVGGQRLAQLAGGREASSPEQVTSVTAQSFVERAADGALVYRPFARARHGRLRFPSLGETLRSMALFVRSGFHRLPLQPVAPWEAEVEDRLSRWARRGHGIAEHLVASADGRSLDDADAATAAHAQARQLLQSIEAAAATEPTPELWQELRATCFGLVDGGLLPSYIEEPRERADRAVVLAVEHVVPKPDREHFVVAHLLPAALAEQPVARVPVRACDPCQARRALAWLEKLASDSSDQVTTHAAQSARRQLDEWVRQRRSAFVWRVAERLADGLDRAGEDLAAAVREVAGGSLKGAGPDVDPKRMRRDLRARWAAVAALATLGAVTALLSPLYGARTQWAVAGLGASLLLWAGGWFGSFLACQRRAIRLHDRHGRAAYTLVQALDAVEASAREVARLASLYQQLRDWAEVLGWSLHLPQGATIPAQDERPRPSFLPQPLALDIAAGRQTSEALDLLRAETSGRVFGTGWLMRMYGVHLEHAMPLLARSRGVLEDAPDLDPDRDVHGGLRAALLALVREGVLAQAWWASLRDRLARDLGHKPAVELFPLVQPVGAAAAPSEPGDPPRAPATRATAAFVAEILPVTDADFRPLIAPSVWSRAARREHAHYVERVALWAPAAAQPDVAGEGDSGAMITHRITGGDLSNDLYALQVIRLDMAREVPCTQLTLFESDG